MKMFIGNALFAAIMVGWYVYIHGETNWASAGPLMTAHVQSLKHADEADGTMSGPSAEERVRNLLHAGDNNWMVSGAVMAFASFLSGIVMGYLLRGPGKARRPAVRQTGEVVLVAAPAMAAHPAPAPAPVAAAPPAPAAEHFEPDIPGPDDLDALEPEVAKPVAVPAVDVFELEDLMPAAKPAVAYAPVAAGKQTHHDETVLVEPDVIPTID